MEIDFKRHTFMKNEIFRTAKRLLIIPSTTSLDESLHFFRWSIFPLFCSNINIMIVTFLFLCLFICVDFSLSTDVTKCKQ